MSLYLAIPKPTFPAEEVVGPNNPLPVDVTRLGGSAVSATNPIRTADATTRSVFGEPVFAQITPIVRAHFTYGLSSRKVSTALKSSGGAITASGGAAAPATTNGADLIVSIDNAANAYAVARSVRSVHYYPGMGQMARLTCAFNAGVANSRQFAGLWSPNAEWTVGYNGVTWGCFAKTAGAQAVYSLTITTAATSGADATVTLDGTAVAVTLTNQTGNPSRTAREIAAGVYTAAGQAGTWGWNAYALGATVYFVARRARAVAGSFSYSAGTTGSAATGGMVEVRRGTAETLDFGSPATPGKFTFMDPCDGTGVLPNLDKTKGVIYEIQAGHLGHRGCVWAVPDTRTGLPIPFARYNYHNTSATSVMQNPAMWVANGIEANGSTTAMTLRSGSWFGGVVGMVGDDALEGEPFSASAGKGATNGTAVHYASVQGGPVAGFSGQIVRPARTDLRVHHVTISVTGGSAGNYVDCSFILNGTYTNLATFAAADANRLAAWKCEDTTTNTVTLTGGTVINSPRVVTNAGTVLIPVDLSLEPGETLGVNVTASAVNLQCDISIAAVEIGG